MIKFILRPVAQDESSVTFQMLADSPTRKRGFVANCVMTRLEFITFRTILNKGVAKSKKRGVVIHPDLAELKLTT